MAHLQQYTEQMGGFDFTLTQRYRYPYLETNCYRTRTSLNQSPTKKQAPPS